MLKNCLLFGFLIITNCKCVPDESRAVEVQDVGDVVAAVDLDAQGDSILPPCRIDPHPLSDDRLIKVVSNDVVAVGVTAEQLRQAVHLFVVDPIFSVGAVLDPVLEDVLAGVGPALSGDAGHVLDGAHVDSQGLFHKDNYKTLVYKRILLVNMFFPDLLR
jgi:hypothetical protein